MTFVYLNYKRQFYSVNVIVQQFKMRLGFVILYTVPYVVTHTSTQQRYYVNASELDQHFDVS